MKKKKSLETIVKPEPGHVRHFDPIDAISHHVVAVVFIALLFLASLVMFFLAEPTQEATTYAIYTFEPITIHKEIGTGITEFVDSVRHSENRPLVLLSLYTFWIIIFGLVNMVLYERELERKK